MNQTVCPTSGDDDRARLYVAGQLSSDEAEEFEQHMFECDECAAEVQQAVEIRSALRGRGAARGGWRVGLAIAATVAAVALGLWQLQLHETNLAPPPLRGAASHEIAATGRLSGTIFTASWKAVADARSYRVQIFNSIGEPVIWNETTDTHFRVDLGSSAKNEYWKVQAFNDDHAVIATSALMKIQ